MSAQDKNLQNQSLAPQQQAAAIDLMTYEPPHLQDSLAKLHTSMQAQPVPSTQPVAGVSPIGQRPPVPIFDQAQSSHYTPPPMR